MATRKRFTWNLLFGVLMAAGIAFGGKNVLADECCVTCPAGCVMNFICCSSAGCESGFNCSTFGSGTGKGCSMSCGSSGTFYFSCDDYDCDPV